MRRISVSVFIITVAFIINAFAYELKEYASPGRSKSFSLVLIPLGCPDKDIFLKDVKNIKKGLLETRPFSEFKNMVNIFYVILKRQEEGVLFRRREEDMPPVKVRIDLMQDISKTISPYKLIILDYSGNAACAELSLIDKTSLVILGRNRYSNELDFLKGFLHELGHSLGLRDECIKCQESEPGFPNCAPTKELATKWWGSFIKDAPGEVNYIKGCCGNIKYFRPSIASLMNDIARASGYGYVNEIYLKQEFLRLQGS